MKDEGAPRFDWEMAVVERVFPSASDNHVRKVDFRLFKDGSNGYYTRPVTETVLLISV